MLLATWFIIFFLATTCLKIEKNLPPPLPPPRRSPVVVRICELLINVYDSIKQIRDTDPLIPHICLLTLMFN